MTNLKNTLIRTAGVAVIALLAGTGIASATVTVVGTPNLKANAPGANPFSQGLLTLGTSTADQKNNGFASGTVVQTETITFTNGTNGGSCFGGCQTATASGEFAGSITDVVATPFGTGVGANDTKDYLAAGAKGGGTGAAAGTVTITFATAQTELDILWGSVDFSSQNTLLELSNNQTITGLQVCLSNPGLFGTNTAGCNAGTNSGDYDAYVAITGLGSFTSVTFSDNSQNAAFEFVPTAPAPVPEPLTLSLFGAGLAGTAMIRRRKGKKA